MTGSSKTTSFADQSTSVLRLNVKQGQNLILDLTSLCYNEAQRPMIECLRCSPLAQALTMPESITLIHLSNLYSSVSYVLVGDVINFKVDSRKTSTSKSRFYRVLGYDSTEGLVDPDLISSIDLIHIFY